ncbi:MAG: hypothetical protein KGI97_03095, partial [Alphaproteobacteria bacterium]|nr:hypothetical protein [Alphaproteobacteria bacterium]
SLRRLYGEEFKKRLDDAFGWKPKNAAYGKNDRGGWKNRAAQTPVPFVNRARPQSKRRQMEKILLALMINHPELFDEFGENLAHLDFETPEFETMRRRLIDLLSESSLDAVELRRALADPGEDRIVYEDNSGVLDEILSPDTYLHAKGALPDAAPEIAQRTWVSTWQLHEHDLLLSALEEAKRRYSKDRNDENWQQIIMLQAQIHQTQQAVGGD